MDDPPAGDPLTQTELSIVLLEVEAAVRRLGRADAAFRVDWTHATTDPPGPLSPEALEAMFAFQDAMDHALVSTNRACQGRRYLEGRGLTLPEISQPDLIRSLRDLQEHWTEWLPTRDPLSVDEKPWLRTRSAGKRLEAVAPPMWEGRSSGSADQGLQQWQGIDIPCLRRELDDLQALIAALTQAAPRHPSLEEFDESTGTSGQG